MKSQLKTNGTDRKPAGSEYGQNKSLCINEDRGYTALSQYTDSNLRGRTFDFGLAF